MLFSGPAADSPLLRNVAKNTAKGTVNNCGSGPTPWGTYITCEENFNGYFGDRSAIKVPIKDEDGKDVLDEDGNVKTKDVAVEWTITPEQGRYGFAPRGFGYGWENHDDRFDLSNDDYANECNRFGWCVEIDPSTPMPIRSSEQR